ncbi:transposase [Rouxiella badensis]|uniref:transposase n=1 Tax=Rouxiella badensis TaxID=1646377 RepID=UPI003B8A7FF2
MRGCSRLQKRTPYASVVSDLQGRPLQLTDDCGVESLASYLRSLREHQLDEIETLSMDMNMAYISAARIHLPNAIDKIAFDHFHVAKMLCSVV